MIIVTLFQMRQGRLSNALNTSQQALEWGFKAKRKSFTQECAAASHHPQSGRKTLHAMPLPQLLLSAPSSISCSLYFRLLENLKHFHRHLQFSSVQFSPAPQSCPTLCNPMDCSTPGLPVHHQLPEVYPNSCPLSR